MKYAYLSFLVVLLFVLNGCNQEAKRNLPDQYLDVRVFTEQQISLLDSIRPSVEKEVASGEKRETKTSNEIDWKKELELFIQADINKSAYRNAYTVEKESESTTLYKAKAGEDIPVKYLKIESDPVSKRIKSAEALLTSENYLYESQKKIRLECAAQPNGGWLIQSYQMTGYQQLAFFEKKSFEVNGKVLKQL